MPKECPPPLNLDFRPQTVTATVQRATDNFWLSPQQGTALFSLLAFITMLMILGVVLRRQRPD